MEKKVIDKEKGKNVHPIVDLKGRGFTVVCRCVAVIRTKEGFAVGVQEAFRSGGSGRLWRTLKTARSKAALLAGQFRLPVVESL